MNESLSGYTKLLFKLFVDRRPFRGPTEFSYRITSVGREFYRIKIASREGDFRRTVALRRHTSDLATFEQVFANNDYNLRRLARYDGICELYKTIIKRDCPLILDLGANIGLSALYFAKNWPAANIVAVEPGAQNFRMMCENIGGLTNIHPVNAAVANADGLVQIANPDAAEWALRTKVAATGDTDTIDALSVRHLIELAHPARKPFIAKIDIEGFESNLFSDNTDWVEEFPIIIIELHDWLLPRQGTSNNFLRVIAQQGRDCVFIGENVISLKN